MLSRRELGILILGSLLTATLSGPVALSGPVEKLYLKKADDQIIVFTEPPIAALIVVQDEWEAKDLHQLSFWKTTRATKRAVEAIKVEVAPVRLSAPNPQPAPQPPPNPAPAAPGVEQWRGLVATYFQSEDVEAALRVIQCESGFVLTAKNPTSSALGPWQFLKSTWDDMVAPHTGSPSYDAGGPIDPVWSTINAAWLWYNVGPSQWTCW